MQDYAEKQSASKCPAHITLSSPFNGTAAAYESRDVRKSACGRAEDRDADNHNSNLPDLNVTYSRVSFSTPGNSLSVSGLKVKKCIYYFEQILDE